MQEELSKQVLDVIACPKCKSDLDYDKEAQKLFCSSCKIAFKIENSVPIMLVEKAEKP